MRRQQPITENRMKPGLLKAMVCAAMAAGLVSPAIAQGGAEARKPVAQSSAGVIPADAIAASDSLLAKGDYQAARAALDAAIKAEGDFYPLVLRYAYLSYLLKDYDLADSYYSKAAQLGPREEAPLDGLMNTALARHDARWKVHAAALLAMNADHYGALTAVAYDDFSSKRYRQASERFHRLVSQNVNDADARRMLGWSQFYLGDYGEARDSFNQALKLNPGDASAREGLGYLPRTFTFGAGYCFAALNYSNNEFEKKGKYFCVPVTLGYKDKLSLTFMYAHTTIDWASPTPQTKQEDRNVSGAYAISPNLTVLAAFDQILLTDAHTNGGKIWTGGVNYSHTLPFEHGYAAVGGWVSNSDYPDGIANQASPHVGIGVAGQWFVDVFLHHIYARRINADSLQQRGTTDAVGAAVALGPYFGGLMVNAKAYAGEKRLTVDDWGVTVVNTPDLYRGGWKLGCSFAHKYALFNVSYGRDSVRAYYGAAQGAKATVDYTAAVALAGITLKFGY